MTEPVSARSSPAITISRVDLPEPDGPMRPIASPLAYMQVDVLEDMTRAAPRPSDRLTPVSAIAGASRDPEVSCMQSFRRSFLPGSGAAGSASPRSYGAFGARVQTVARADEPGSGSGGAHTTESPRWPLAPLAGAARGGHLDRPCQWLRSHRTIRMTPPDRPRRLRHRAQSSSNPSRPTCQNQLGVS